MATGDPGDDTRGTDLESVINDAAMLATRKMRTGAVACVLAYDAATQRVDVRPVNRITTKVDAGQDPFVLPPILPKVPVIFPSGGNFSLTWPLEVGDFVYLVFNERSIDEWQRTGGVDVQQQSKRRFHASDALAIPQPRPLTSPLQCAVDDGITFGQDDYRSTIPDPSIVRVYNDGRMVFGKKTNRLADVLNIIHASLVALNADTAITAPTKLVLAAQILLIDSLRKP